MFFCLDFTGKKCFYAKNSQYFSLFQKETYFYPCVILKHTVFSYAIKRFFILKNFTLKYFIAAICVFFIAACSTRKDKFINRNFQAVNTEFNVLYNGNIALEAGISDLKLNYQDNFWEILPIERMQITDDLMEGDKKNPNFKKAEEKATKAIQKRSMLIGGSEKNPQMDEAHLLLGKSRYYEQRFIPALEAFNYILYKSPASDKIYEAKIWREKTNIRLEYDALAIKNLRKLLSEIKFKDQIFSDANAILAQAFLNVDEKDSAISRLKVAREFTKRDEEKARYSFILGQIYEALNQKDSAFMAFQSVIDMKRKSPRLYVIQAHAKQAQQFDFQKGDTLQFLEKFDKLIADRENRPYLDILYHQKGLFYDKLKKPNQAIVNYNKSLKAQSSDNYLLASDYRNLAEIYFYKAKYQMAGVYYDSTLVLLDNRSREFKAIKKKRDNLVDVIKYEGIAQRNDSILNIVGLSENDRISFYQDYIEDLKKNEALVREKEEKSANVQGAKGTNPMTNQLAIKNNASIANQGSFNASGKSNFYFYNQSTVDIGKREFQKKWGNRLPNGNWRLNSKSQKANEEDIVDEAIDKQTVAEKNNPLYSPDFYISQLPSSKTEIDSIGKERNFAYYQLGVIYKEKFKEYQLSADRFEILLKSKPEERLVLPAMYNLFKVYEIINPEKALPLKEKIIAQYPDSRYAQILSKSTSSNDNLSNDPEIAYKNLYKAYENAEYRILKTNLDLATDKFTGEEVMPKLELLKANVIAKLSGIHEYKKAVNYVALTYPNADEGKEAEELLGDKILYLESLYFDQEEPSSFKILYQADNLEDKKVKLLIDKVNKFIKERNQAQLFTSVDLYTMDQNFFVVHGLKDEEYAKGVVSILKEFKDYKITEKAIIISSENYKIVQMRKNLNEYLNPELRITPPTYTPKPKRVVAEQSKGEIIIPHQKQQAAPAEQPKSVLTPPSGNDPMNPVNSGQKGSPKDKVREEPRSAIMPPSEGGSKKG